MNKKILSISDVASILGVSDETLRNWEREGKLTPFHCLAQAISDVGLHEFRRQIEYKAKWNNRKVIFADTFFASSKLCSCCGWKNENFTLKDRIFECKVCDMRMDRDLNASLNLKQIYTVSSTEIQACGDGSSEKVISLSPSVKQEFNKKSRVYILKV